MLLKFCLLLLSLSLTTSCPAGEKLRPCVCESADYSMYIKCDGIDNDNDLINAASALKGLKYIYSFTIENAILNYIPHNLFEGVNLVELEFLTSSFMAFTDTDVAFVGLEESLEILLVTECNFMNSWDWSLLKNMKKLMRLDIVNGDLESVGEDVREISNLNMKDISFADNKISYIYEYAFTNFTELKFLTLSNNLIEEVKRSMFPNPATELMHIDIGYNKIQNLPEDMFTAMPILEAISVVGNELLILNENTFTPVWEQLEDFAAFGNKLRCDCRMAWILKLKMPPNTRAMCDQPQNLKGRALNSLTSKDLWC